ncbi:MAG TPA: acyltransferase family protein [Acidimicrobiales bacterium]|jgi:peptidoglycan/LPS O-acetylase OafA/YrhL|nr:acyltransferase family protein [Acidimicrobiales bacterium]
MGGIADELAKLHALYDQGALTSVEFESAKARVIAASSSHSNADASGGPTPAGTRVASARPRHRGQDADLFTPPRRSILFIHGLRGMAALLVVWSHLAGYWLYAYNRNWKPQTVWENTFVIPLHLYQNAGDLAVVLFFLVSGYIITHISLKESHLQFGVKRFFRIFPPLAVALFIAFVCVTIAVHLHAVGALPRAPGVGVLPGVGPKTGFVLYLRSFFLMNWLPAGSGYVLGQTWTLLIEIMFYVLTFVLLTRSRRSPLAGTWAMFGIWLVANMIFLSFTSGHEAENYVIYIAFLVFGRGLYLLHERKITLAEAITLLSALVLCFVLFHTVEFPGVLGLPDWQSPAAGYVIAIIVFVALMQVKVKRLPRFLRFFGDISYSLYLLHIPIGMLTIDVLYNFHLPFTLCFLAGVTASIGASYASYRLVEVPFQRIGRRLLSSRRSGEDFEVVRRA